MPIAPELLTIILPRHPNRKDEITTTIEQSALSYSCRSEGAVPSKDTAVYLADTMGETGLFYKLCKICIIGGSFIPWGGHNIIEPAQFGCQVFYGPHMQNFISICDDFESAKASLRLKDFADLKDTISVALKDPEYYAHMAKQAKLLTDNKAHVIDELSDAIAPFIRKVIKQDQRIAS